jgi:LysR family glycine cleavage system transcriptional activator
MQGRAPHLSLNGVRAFEVAARLRSLKAAAAELGVTPSAISHQVKQLEEAVGTRLFLRRNNGIDLTADGRRFYEAVGPALASIARAGEAIRRDTQEVVLKVSTSLALRWLIPRLHEFRRAHPRIRVRMETGPPPVALESGVDLVVHYSRRGAAASDAIHLLADECRPVASPMLARRYARGTYGAPILAAPIISATSEDWDWRRWALAQKIDFARLQIVDHFDTDHAALEACVAGLGVFMPSLFLVERELANGTLVPFGDYPTLTFGDYWLIAAKPLRRAVEIFIAWLLAAARTSAETRSGDGSAAD